MSSRRFQSELVRPIPRLPVVLSRTVVVVEHPAVVGHQQEIISLAEAFSPSCLNTPNVASCLDSNQLQREYFQTKDFYLIHSANESLVLVIRRGPPCCTACLSSARMELSEQDFSKISRTGDGSVKLHNQECTIHLSRV